MWGEWSRRVADCCGWPLALAVQEGCTPEQVARLRPRPDVVFVGGNTAWKLRTVRDWCRAFPRVHVGRIGTEARLRLVDEAGAESSDSTVWHPVGHHLKALRRYLEWSGKRHYESAPSGVWHPIMITKVKNQTITDRYALYHGDCCTVLPGLPNESVGFSVFSPPFADLYSYSDDLEDVGNARSYQEFFTHFTFVVGELFRLLQPGRVVAVHCMDLPLFKRNGDEIGCRDFSGDLIRCFQEAGFVYHCPRITIWKDPLAAAFRTKAIGLAHKQIVKDSALCRTGIPDYVVAFRKPGVNPVPVRHGRGLTQYHGARAVPHFPSHFTDPDTGDRVAVTEDQRKNRRSQWIWQQYASPVWFDIRQTKTLQYRQARGPDDEKHICPLQLDVIERCLELWSAPGDVVLSPFAGVGSELYVAVKNGRRGVGVELKKSYFKQMVRNLSVLRAGKAASLKD